MRIVLHFALLGPLAGGISLSLLSLIYEWPTKIDILPVVPMVFLFMLPAIYVLGILPALITSGIYAVILDKYKVERKVTRAVIAASIGAIVSWLLMWTYSGAAFAIAGAIAGALCSLIPAKGRN